MIENFPVTEQIASEFQPLNVKGNQILHKEKILMNLNTYVYIVLAVYKFLVNGYLSVDYSSITLNFLIEYLLEIYYRYKDDVVLYLTEMLQTTVNYSVKYPS